MAQIGDLLVKLGRGETLTLGEEGTLRLWGNQAQLDSFYVTGLQNGQGEINAGTIIADTLDTGSTRYSDFYCYFDASGTQTIPNNVSTNITLSYTALENRGFSVSSGIITFPVSGFYLIQIWGDFASNATGYRQLLMDRISGSGFGNCSEAKNAISGAITPCFVSGEMTFDIGKTGVLNVRQTSGGDLDITNVGFSIRLASLK